MKQLLKYLLPAVVVLLAAAACEDHRSDNLEEFQTMVYFRNGGEQSLTLYRTGEDGIYRVPVCKSGRNLQGEAVAEVIPFNEASLAIYNVKEETDYRLIPANLFQFVDGNGAALPDQSKVKLNFGPDDTFQVITLKLNTVEISALKEKDPDHDYVLGFQLFSEGNVSQDINLIILKPDIDIPSLSLLSPGVESHKYTSASPATQTYTNTVTLNMEENLWDFTCNLTTGDAAWLEEYNYNNAKNFELLPAGAFKLPQTQLSFSKGVLDATFDVQITREHMDMMKEYALPVILTSCSKPEFAIDPKKNVYILNVRLDPDQITLTADMVEVSANHEGDGTGAPALVDGDPLTYWHSPWSGAVNNADPTYGIYVDISLKSPLRAIVMSYRTRYQNANGVPTHVVVGVSNDKTNWTVIEGGDVATAEMAAASTNTLITLPPMKHSSTFKYIRFGIAESVAGNLCINYASSPAWTSLSELELYGTTD